MCTFKRSRSPVFARKWRSISSRSQCPYRALAWARSSNHILRCSSICFCSKMGTKTQCSTLSSKQLFCSQETQRWPTRSCFHHVKSWWSRRAVKWVSMSCHTDSTLLSCGLRVQPLTNQIISQECSLMQPCTMTTSYALSNWRVRCTSTPQTSRVKRASSSMNPT